MARHPPETSHQRREVCPEAAAFMGMVAGYLLALLATSDTRDDSPSIYVINWSNAPHEMRKEPPDLLSIMCEGGNIKV